MIRIGLADDQELVRAGLRMIVGSQPDLSVQWEAIDGADCVRKATTSPVDVVLMDIRMPNLDGIGATKQLMQLDVAPKVLVLTTFEIDQYVVDAIAAGAGGFLLKDTPGEELVDVVRQIHAGDRVVRPAELARLVSGNGTRRPTLAQLSERETDVVKQICTGASNAEIAAALFVSETTVKTHVRSILRKLDLRDRVQIVVAAHQSGLR